MKRTFLFSFILVSILGLFVSCDLMNQKNDSKNESSNTESSANNSTSTKTETVTYEVSFVSNGGSSVASKKVKKGEAIEEMPESQKDGAALAGWYFDSGLKEKVHFPYIPAENITLYAKWALPPVDATFSATTNVTRTAKSGGNPSPIRSAGLGSDSYSYTGHCSLTISRSNTEYFSHYEIYSSLSGRRPTPTTEQTESSTFEVSKPMGTNSSGTINVTVYVVDTFGQKSPGVSKSFNLKYQ